MFKIYDIKDALALFSMLSLCIGGILTGSGAANFVDELKTKQRK